MSKNVRKKMKFTAPLPSVSLAVRGHPLIQSPPTSHDMTLRDTKTGEIIEKSIVKIVDTLYTKSGLIILFEYV
jgi:hypothetical protein